MTVSDLTPLQLYGILMAANLMTFGALYAIWKFDRTPKTSGKLFLLLALFFILFLPAFLGIDAMRPPA